MEPTFFTPEMIAAIVQAGGTPAILLLVIWRAWNGTSKKVTETNIAVKKMDERFNAVDTRLVKIETILEEREY